jgi:hypothetical protein
VLRPNSLRLLLTCLLGAGLLCAQAPPPTPRVGVIDFYGLRKVSEAKVRKELGFKEGDPLPPSKGGTEDRLEEIPGVTEARLEAVCCDDNKRAILYVGIEEKGAPHFNYRPPPSGDAVLPADIVPVYARFLGAVAAAGQKGPVSEDLTRGHSFMSDPKVRSLQEAFVGFATKYTVELRNVLRDGANEEQRAMAAYIIGYAPNKERVVNDLQYALQDPDDTVRNNAMRSLAAFAVLKQKDPSSEVKIAPIWLVGLLNSLVWGDRHTAAVTLVTITENREPETLSLIKERAMPALAEMASWKSLAHALPAYILLGRAGGLKEAELQDAWSKGQRMAIIKKVMADQ